MTSDDVIYTVSSNGYCHYFDETHDRLAETGLPLGIARAYSLLVPDLRHLWIGSDRGVYHVEIDGNFKVNKVIQNAPNLRIS